MCGGAQCYCSAALPVGQQVWDLPGGRELLLLDWRTCCQFGHKPMGSKVLCSPGQPGWGPGMFFFCLSEDVGLLHFRVQAGPQLPVIGKPPHGQATAQCSSFEASVNKCFRVLTWWTIDWSSVTTPVLFSSLAPQASAGAGCRSQEWVWSQAMLLPAEARSEPCPGSSMGVFAAGVSCWDCGGCWQTGLCPGPDPSLPGHFPRDTLLSLHQIFCCCQILVSSRRNGLRKQNVSSDKDEGESIVFCGQSPRHADFHVTCFLLSFFIRVYFSSTRPALSYRQVMSSGRHIL